MPSRDVLCRIFDIFSSVRATICLWRGRRGIHNTVAGSHDCHVTVTDLVASVKMGTWLTTNLWDKHFTQNLDFLKLLINSNIFCHIKKIFLGTCKGILISQKRKWRNTCVEFIVILNVTNTAFWLVFSILSLIRENIYMFCKQFFISPCGTPYAFLWDDEFKKDIIFVNFRNLEILLSQIFLLSNPVIKVCDLVATSCDCK